jgi:hypothetical protein
VLLLVPISQTEGGDNRLQDFKRLQATSTTETSKDFTRLHRTSGDFTGFHRTSRNFKGLHGTSRDFTGLHEERVK